MRGVHGWAEIKELAEMGLREGLKIQGELLAAGALLCRFCGCPLERGEVGLRECHAKDGGVCRAVYHPSHSYPTGQGHCHLCDVHIDDEKAREPCVPEQEEATATSAARYHDLPPGGAE